MIEKMEEDKPRNIEVLLRSTDEKEEYWYINEESNPIHKALEVFKESARIISYPYTFSETHGLRTPKIKTIELRGWEKVSDVPKTLKNNRGVRLVGAAKYVFSSLGYRLKRLEKVTIVRKGRNRITETSVTLDIDTFKKITNRVTREKNHYLDRRKAALADELASITRKVNRSPLKLTRGGISNHFALYSEVGQLSDEDVSEVLRLVGDASFGNISVRENFIETRDKVNIAFLEDIASEFDRLMSNEKKNEKDWQDFFERNCWILSHLFPYEVLLYQREALVGGKTLRNDEGRLVDFLFANGFSDNYALVEIKTHNTKLLKSTAYRAPATYPMHDDLSGGLNQCLDQRNVFLSENGDKYGIRDPKSILIIGTKAELNKHQAQCFELVRNNQKNVDIVTFDELRAKLEGLMRVLKT